MFKHLLVPLDGTRLAEAALPAVAYLAPKLNATVTLLHVLEQHAPQQVHRERHLTSAETAGAYLAEVAERAFPPGITVERHVHDTAVDDVAVSLAEHTAELQTPDLVVMCLHGDLSPRRWFFGCLGQQVLALGRTPVLLLRSGLFTLRKIFVPLDGNPEHEGGLPFATALAQACQASVHLAMVVPTLGTLSAERAATGRLLPRTMAAMLEIEEENAQAYLRPHLARLQTLGLTATAEVARGDPAPTIATLAQRANADLIALGTHGRAGPEAFRAGSVAPKVASRTNTPLLLVPAQETE